MKWSDIPFKPTPKTLRQFAGGWLVFFLGAAALQGLSRGQPRLGVFFAILAVVVGGLGLLKPVMIRWLFVSWMVVAFPIGWTISQLMVGLMFYGIITPVALLFRVRGRDPLCRKPKMDATTYWSAKETPTDVRRYLRQY